MMIRKRGLIFPLIMGILIFRLVDRGAGGVFGLGWIGTGGCYKRLVMEVCDGCDRHFLL